MKKDDFVVIILHWVYVSVYVFDACPYHVPVSGKGITTSRLYLA